MQENLPVQAAKRYLLTTNKFFNNWEAAKAEISSGQVLQALRYGAIVVVLEVIRPFQATWLISQLNRGKDSGEFLPSDRTLDEKYGQIAAIASEVLNRSGIELPAGL